MATVAELIIPKTAAQVESNLLAELASAGFPVTAWQPGSVPRTLVKAFAVALALLWVLVVDVVRGGYVQEATRTWLTLHAKSRFGLDRIVSTFARHSLTLNVASGAGPHTITPGQLLLASASGLRYRSTNTTNVVIAGGGSQAITVQCETAGTVGNTAPSTLVTPTVAGLSFTWGSLSVRARDDETDAELRARCLARWATLGRGASRAAYEYHARSATLNDGTNAGVTRIAWLNPPGDGSFTIVVAGSDGPLATDQVTAVQAYVSDLTRRAYTDNPIILNATAVNVVPAGTVYVRAAYNTPANRLRAEDALRALAASLEIGQTLDIFAIGAALRAAEGVYNINLTVPAGDTFATTTEVVTIDRSTIMNPANWVSV